MRILLTYKNSNMIRDINDQLELAHRITRGAFKDKRDLSGDPYLWHCLRVGQKASLMNRNLNFKTGVTNQQCELVGILHDLLEDCPDWTEGALRTLFDKELVDAIVVLTKAKGEDYDDYIGRVVENPIARIVKIVDLEDNMDITRFKTFSDVNIDRLRKYHKSHKRINKYLKP